MTTKVKAPNKDLFDEVIDAGLCTICGACAGGCPYLVPYKGRIALLDNCTLSEGQCYQYCPRTYTDLDALSQLMFGVPYSEDELGNVKEILMARSTDVDIEEKAQYGGTVTSLLSLALGEGLIDSAILSRTSDDKTPRACVARSTKDLLHCIGSNYMACPVLEELNRVPRDSKERLGIVVTPCQALALGKMRKDPPESRADIGNVKLVIGLFCTWALSPEAFHKFLEEKLDLPQVIKFDIPPPPANRFDAYTPAGMVSFPLDEIREFVMLSCTYCLDMTSEFADISVGAVEGAESWNTVIVRTDTGAKLIALAKKKGKIEVDELPSQNLSHLKESALLKKRRALKENAGRDLSYIGMSKNILEKLLS